ncbi:hypothetical protein C8J56DRAFT_898443 [Mycena floridula]|nr:hypothetical protein C8J56DRAFT_898443 [Mycena floridula]
MNIWSYILCLITIRQQLALAKKLLREEAYSASLAARTLVVEPPMTFFETLASLHPPKPKRKQRVIEKPVGPADIKLDDNGEIMGPVKRQQRSEPDSPPCAGPSS